MSAPVSHVCRPLEFRSEALRMRVGGARSDDDSVQRHVGAGRRRLDRVLGVRRSGRDHGSRPSQSASQISFPRKHLRLARRKCGNAGEKCHPTWISGCEVWKSPPRIFRSAPHEVEPPLNPQSTSASTYPHPHIFFFWLSGRECYRLSNGSIFTLVEYSPVLKSLKVKGCRDVGEGSLRRIAAKGIEVDMKPPRDYSASFARDVTASFDRHLNLQI